MNKIIKFIVRTITKSLQLLSDQWSKWWLTRLFFSPPSKHKQRLELQNMQTHWLQLDSVDGEPLHCKIYEAGSGPTILMLHGWEGSAFSYSVMSAALVEAGYHVILCDFPAHGQSSGRASNLKDWQMVIKTLSSKFSDLHAVIGHSFGAFAMAYAIKLRLNVKRIISISSPIDMDFLLNRFCSTVGASHLGKKHIITVIEQILQARYDTASIRNNELLKRKDGLIIHDETDKVVPYDHGVAFASLWPRAQLMTTSGLGHSRILKDQGVIAGTIDFLRSE